jgi:mono/diheme cytochrome c family protein
MNFAGAPKTRQAFHGGRFSTWFAPDITTNKRTGLGAWSRPDVVELLRTARNAHAQTSGEMGEVVSFSTSHLTDGDLEAIATYLGDLPPSPMQTPGRADPAVMRQGQAVWVDACSACHRMDGSGVPRFFPPVSNSANAQQRDATTMVHIILAGTRTGPTQTAPTPLSMPSYAWKLTDDQIAAVSTFVRNSWGNQASAVTARQVADLRKRFAFGPGPAGRIPRRPMDSPNPGTYAPPHTDSRDNGTANAGRTAAANDTIDTGAPGGGNATAPAPPGAGTPPAQGPG